MAMVITMLKYFLIILIALNESNFGDAQPEVNNTFLSSLSCGKIHEDSGESRIGKNSYSGGFPWDAEIYKTSSTVSVSGSLIHPQVVLTAAYYFVGEKPENFRVYFGKSSKSTTDFSIQDRNVYNIIIHEKYDNSSLNDFALVILSEPVTLGDKVNTICLPSADIIFDKNQCLARVRKDELSIEMSKALFIINDDLGNSSPFLGDSGRRKTKHYNLTKIITHNDCQGLLRGTHLGGKFNLPRNLICIDGENRTSFEDNERGSPLVCHLSGNSSRYVLVGSLFENNVYPGKDQLSLPPKVYGNLFNQRLWIDQNMRKYGWNLAHFIDPVEKKNVNTKQSPPKVQNCGRSHIDKPKINSSDSQYSGGFPWNAKIFKITSPLSVSGTLIHPQVILTAARRLKGQKPSEIRVRVGELFTPNMTLPIQERNVSNIIYENYSVDDDIVEVLALLILSDPVKLADNVNTICLPDSSTTYDGSQCFARILENDRFESQNLMILRSIIDYDACQESLRKEIYLSSSSVCILGETPQKLCDIVPGSPLVCPILEEPGRYVQVGALSEIDTCRLKNQSSASSKVYESISRARLWIDQQMDKQGFDTSSYTQNVQEPSFKIRDCGRSRLDRVESKINNSSETYFGELPWMVEIMRVDESEFLCAGSIIHPQIILTTANCLDSYELKQSEIKIRAGRWNTQSATEILPHQDRNVSEIILHEEYNNTVENNESFNDFALIVLTEPFTFADNINTICLPKDDTSFDQSRCSVTGWGNDLSGEGVLTKLPAQIITQDACQQSFSKVDLLNYLNESLICVGEESPLFIGNGARGSPMVCSLTGEPNRYVQVGIFSTSNSYYNELNLPNLYANISYARKWIKKELNDLYDTANVEPLVD